MHVRFRLLAGPASAVLLICGSFLPVSAADAELERLEEQAFKQAAALVDPSVVRIQTVGGLDRVGEMLTGTGPTTGVVVSDDGYIISSAFNFISQPSSILVQLPDERRFPAEMVATDRSRMLTLLKIEADDLIPVAAADKESVYVGQWAIALGRTYEDVLPSVSVGIVSALNRIWGKAIQTDAKVSPVNYGGPLVDVEGNVLGVLVPLSPQGNEETAGVEWYDGGIGFAIPMQDVFDAVERLKSGEDLRPGLMGIEFAGRDRLAGSPTIDRVRVESPADQAGLQPGDVVVEVDGRPTVRQAEVQQALGTKYAGDSVVLTVERDDETLEKELTLVAELVPYESGFLGILPLREGVGDETAAGVGVRYVFADSPAEEAGLQPRDRIVSFNGHDVTGAASLVDLVSRLRPGEEAALVFVRGEEESSIELEVAAIPDAVPGELSSSPIPRPGSEDDEAEAEGDGNADADAAERPAPAGRPQTGRFTEEMPEHERDYWAYVPDDYNPDYPYGLMVWIHPGGDTMEAALYRQWKSICDQRGIILLAPKAGRLGGWNLDEAEFVKEAVERFTERYSIDPGRVFLHGYSTGGAFTYHLAFKHRELFRGVATTAAPLRNRPPENHPDFRLQFHLTCGDQHNLYPAVEATAEGLENLKYPVRFVPLKDRDDQYPPAEQVREIGRWADCLDRI